MPALGSSRSRSLRIGRNCARDLEPPLIAVGKASRQQASSISEAHQGEQLGGSGFGLRLVSTE